MAAHLRIIARDSVGWVEAAYFRIGAGRKLVAYK